MSQKVSSLAHKKISKLGTAGYNLKRQEFQRNETMQARVFGSMSAKRQVKMEAAMTTRVNRRTVDLSGYPDLVVIYLGMRVNRLAGIKTLLGFGPKISASATANPDGLLRHEIFVYSLFPMHLGIRQYWRDADSLLKWTRSAPHRQWWKDFLGDSGGTGFWHEAYFLQGGMEAVYDDVSQPIGFLSFAPVVPARGPMFGAAARGGKQFASEPVLSEKELYGDPVK